MATSFNKKAIAPLAVVFLLVNSTWMLFGKFLADKGIDPLVVGYGNGILFILSLGVFFMQKKSLSSNNPNAFVRSVMAGTAIKLVVIAAAVVIYVYVAGESKSRYAIYVCMALYFLYTFIEVKTISRINKENGSR
ncbi:hypothetical protein [Limnovirga soli]|jgi:hypothetical protein|uniref:ATP synthase subunit I n=1 Tax=Limnovirga soli TaxID=2656915 RepID=A0A8J8JV95_9BACT|nr:hypothetical protein [Limnovirga soli]NNV56389.1 hypothetical protein [Limnovirga soli]